MKEIFPGISIIISTALNHNKMKFNILILTFLFAITSCADSLSGNSDSERVLFEKIEIGMTKSEVEDILGAPDRSDVDSSSDNSLYFYYFTKNKSGMRSELPTVIFDSTGVVKFATYGEGG